MRKAHSGALRFFLFGEWPLLLSKGEVDNANSYD
jgi:hypothetical protein